MASVTASAGVPSNAVPTTGAAERLADHLETPLLDDRSYRVIRLPNKLEALLVHDPDTDKASAALDVNVGNFSDRDDMPGMAHAVEHLLFMGTEKASLASYPIENAYSQYLTSHSGYSNAYTAATSTNYYFEVAASTGTAGADEAKTSTESEKPTPAAEDGEKSPLHGALDRFAQFFIAPLFLDSTLDRELRAVDSENKKNLQSDTWRLNQLSKSLSNPKHPYCHFSTGSLDTLRDKPRERGIEIRSEFIKFHEEHYSANRMKLVVLGRESLDELEAWVSEMFAGVRNKDLPQNRWDDVAVLTKDELLTQYFATPVMDTRELDIEFPFLDEEKLYEAQPSRYLSHLIGHEGPGSILAHIKAKGWANGLGAGSMRICPGSALFSVSIRLTEDGLKNYREIVKVVFQYIAMIKEQPPLEWIVEEMKGMAAVDFRFRQKSPASKFTSRTSSIMQTPLPREWLLSGSSLIRKFDPARITEALGYLRVDNFRMSVVSQGLSDLSSKEKWYGTEYRSEKIPQDFLDELRAASTGNATSAELFLPHKNEFIPTRLEVEKKEVSQPAKAPRLLRNDDHARIWWKKDDRFWVPKGNASFTLRSPLVNPTPANAVKSKLYCELVHDALVEYAYDAELAGLEYDLSSHTAGLDVDVSGYNDKMPVLLEKVLVSMRDLEVKPDRFKVVKERMVRGYRNWDFQQPYQQVGEFSRWLTSDLGWIYEQYLEELIRLEEQDIRDFYPALLSQLHVEALIHGNLYKEDALRLTRLVEDTLKPRPLPQSQWRIYRSLILPAGSDYLYRRTLKDSKDVNHCIDYFLFIGDGVDRVLRAKLLLFSQLTEEPAFDQLRTKEQLGYVVFTGPRFQSTTIGYRVLVQSERTTPYLETRIDAFLTGFGEKLEKMGEEEFERHKRSLINKRSEKLKNLIQECSRFWHHISSEYFDFEQVDHDVAHIRPLTLPDLVAFFKQYISPASPATRAKISIHMLAQGTSSNTTTSSTALTAEQKTKLSAHISQHLTSQGIPADSSGTDKLAARMEKLDLGESGATSPKAGVVAVVRAHLSEDLGLPDEKVQAVLAEGEQTLGTAIGPAEVTKEDEEKRLATVTVVEDIYAYKAGLSVSTGARPVKDLAEYEETEPKL